MAATLQPSASYSFTMRIELPQRAGSFARVAGVIGERGAMLGAIDLERVDRGSVVRDVTVACVDADHAERVVAGVREIEGVKVTSVSDRTFLMHKGARSRSSRRSRSRPATISRWPTRRVSRGCRRPSP